MILHLFPSREEVWISQQIVLLLFSHSVVFNSLWPHGLQHAWFPCPLLSPGVCSNSSPLNQWCHSTILFSVTPFSFCLQSFPASGSFTMSRLFISGGQSIGASASVLPMNIQSWFPLGLTGLISLLSTGLSRVISRTTVQKHQFFGTHRRKKKVGGVAIYVITRSSLGIPNVTFGFPKWC